MQEMTPEICGVLTTPNTTATASDTNGSKVGNKAYVPERTLRDSRNNETYKVRKLADGNCWMTENLRLELTSGQKLTSTDSDLPSGTTATVGMTTQPYNQPSTNRYNWGVASENDFSRATVDRWLSRSTKVNGVWATETTPTVSGAPKANLTGEDQKTGVYYNWYAATVGTGTWDITTAGTEATGSVCPAGWHLPRYSAVNGTSTLAPSGSWESLIRDTYHLITTQGDQGSTAVNDKLHAFPFSLPYQGYVNWNVGATVDQGYSGHFWSAGAVVQTTARLLDIYRTTVSPEHSDGRLHGFSVRCVAK